MQHGKETKRKTIRRLQNAQYTYLPRSTTCKGFTPRTTGRDKVTIRQEGNKSHGTRKYTDLTPMDTDRNKVYFACLPGSPPVWESLRLGVRLSVSPSVRLSVRLSGSLSSAIIINTTTGSESECFYAACVTEIQACEGT